MKTDPDGVSVIMPCFNSALYVADAIKSVLGQDYENWELLLIDNGSTDSTIDILKEYFGKDGRIRILTCDEPGAAAARNTGIAQAKMRYISFLDSDDVWEASKLTAQIEFMKLNKVVFCWSSYQVMTATGQYVRTQLCPSVISYSDLLAKKAVVGCLTVIYDTAALGKVFMLELKMRQDFATWLKILEVCEAKGLRAGGVDAVTARYRLHRDSLTASKFRAVKYQWAVYRQFAGKSIWQSMFLMLQYIVNGLKDRIFGA